MNTDLPSISLAAAGTPLADYLATRREAILEAWQTEVATDEALTSSDNLSGSECRDDIPQVLAQFENSLRKGTFSKASPPEATKTGAPASGGR